MQHLGTYFLGPGTEMIKHGAGTDRAYTPLFQYAAVTLQVRTVNPLLKRYKEYTHYIYNIHTLWKSGNTPWRSTIEKRNIYRADGE
ncbi:hypothetical protein GDO78_005135 [Eleutherodactylus coqui]|uniref:Uncharacterized protein n=1 Tax=Eleutherodactylus coqui TaxID=57060 RepID=A0A8J6KDI9_ELECQ|nr:hypothetical protein GDO78_005135 [Eleutherodactylus coqui]